MAPALMFSLETSLQVSEPEISLRFVRFVCFVRLHEVAAVCAVLRVKGRKENFFFTFEVPGCWRKWTGHLGRPLSDLSVLHKAFQT